MKAAIVKSMFVAVLAVAMTGCAEDAALNEDPLQFNFKVNSSDQTIGDLPPETQLMISMETPTGEPVYSLETISFNKTPEGYTTSGLSVQPGEYVLTEFMLVNPEGEIMYTIPYSNSPLNGSVSNPLGIDVRIAANSPGKIQTEVLDVHKYKPKDFGLASFKIHNSFQLMVTEEGSGKPVKAKAAVLHDEDTVAVFDVPAKKTRISFKGSNDETYKLVIMKEACAQYVTDFTLADWSRTYRSKPMRATLQPAFTMVGSAYGGAEYPFYFYIGGSDANLTINWGDGQTETYSVNESSGIEIAHDYTESGTYPISITGDLDKIVHFYSFYGGSEFSEISFRHLTNLKELLYGLTACPATLDLSHNTNLETAMLPGLRNLQNLILPETHQIKFLEVDGDNALQSDDVNAIIQNMYTNTSAAGRTGGVLGLRASWAQAEDDFSMIGPPSAESLVLLQSLRDDFGWIVHPSESAEKMMADSRIASRRRI